MTCYTDHAVTLWVRAMMMFKNQFRIKWTQQVHPSASKDLFICTGTATSLSLALGAIRRVAIVIRFGSSQRPFCSHLEPNITCCGVFCETGLGTPAKETCSMLLWFSIIRHKQWKSRNLHLISFLQTRFVWDNHRPNQGACCPSWSASVLPW